MSGKAVESLRAAREQVLQTHQPDFMGEGFARVVGYEPFSLSQLEDLLGGVLDAREFEVLLSSERPPERSLGCG
jgi:hypothetical protein